MKSTLGGSLCHVGSRDVCAQASARAPKPSPAMRHLAQSGLHVKVAFNQSRPTMLCPAQQVQQQQRRVVSAQTAAKDRVETDAHHAANGASQSRPTEYLASTAAVHAGERAGRPQMSDALTTPIVQTSTYWFHNTQEVIDYNEGRLESNEYGRYGNPTAKACEDKIKALEGAEDCLISASGMNSVTSMLLSLVPAGGHIVTTSDCYWRTRQFMQTFLPKMNIGVSVISPNDFDGLQQALDKHNVTLFFSESPTNPYLRCVDIEKITKMCHAKVLSDGWGCLGAHARVHAAGGAGVQLPASRGQVLPQRCGPLRMGKCTAPAQAAAAAAAQKQGQA